MSYMEQLSARNGDLQLENAKLREALENERRFSAAWRELHSELLARIAPLNPDAEKAREDEAWAHSGHVGCIARGDDGWVASRWNTEMQRMDQVNATTIHAALRALRAKVEGGSR